jgi:hypothetical protein
MVPKRLGPADPKGAKGVPPWSQTRATRWQHVSNVQMLQPHLFFFHYIYINIYIYIYISVLFLYRYIYCRVTPVIESTAESHKGPQEPNIGPNMSPTWVQIRAPHRPKHGPIVGLYLVPTQAHDRPIFGPTQGPTMGPPLAQYGSIHGGGVA